MNFIIHYDVAALVLTATIMVHYYLRDRIHTRTSVMFRLLMWMHLAACLLDLGTAVMINYAGTVPNGLQYFLNCLYCFTVYGRTPVYLGYLVYVTKGTSVKWNRKDYIMVWGLLMVEVLLIASTPFSNLIFYFDEAGSYFHGPLFDVLYGISIVYYIVAAVQAIKHRTALKKAQITTVQIYTVYHLSV